MVWRGSASSPSFLRLDCLVAGWALLPLPAGWRFALFFLCTSEVVKIRDTSVRESKSNHSSDDGRDRTRNNKREESSEHAGVNPLRERVLGVGMMGGQTAAQEATARRGSIGTVLGACLPAAAPLNFPLWAHRPCDNPIQCMWIAGRPPLCIVVETWSGEEERGMRGPPTRAQHQQAAGKEAKNHSSIQMCGFVGCLVSFPVVLLLCSPLKPPSGRLGSLDFKR